ncbi:MAG: hypothetical protein AAGF90_06320 [Pseudomonadota bacterium]
MRIFRCGYPIVTCIAIAPLVACADVAVFDVVGPAENPETASAPWPKLADVPPAPPQGVFTPGTPDPAAGEAVQIELAAEAENAEARRKAVEGPVQ